MILSSRPLYDIVEHKGLYYIRLGRVIPTWQSGFSCIEAARQFASTHNISDATSDYIQPSVDDIEWIISSYGMRSVSTGVYSLKANGHVFTLDINDSPILLIDMHNGSSDTYYGVDDVIEALDSKSGVDIFSASYLVPTDARNEIMAASSNTKQQNLVRVKSSNLWARGMQMKKPGDNKGDMFIQFKDKNGGPGDTYMYFDVPIRLWRQFLSAPSAGHFFWVNIRNVFHYRKLTGDKKTHLPNGM